MCKTSANEQPPQTADDSDVDEAADETTLVFFVNGKRIDERDVDPRTTLASYLRDTRRQSLRALCR